MVFASKANPEVFELRVTMFHVKHFQEFLRIILFDVNLIFLLSDGHCRASDEPLQQQLQKSDNRQMYLYFKQKNHIHSITILSHQIPEFRSTFLVEKSKKKIKLYFYFILSIILQMKIRI